MTKFKPAIVYFAQEITNFVRFAQNARFSTLQEKAATYKQDKASAASPTGVYTSYTTKGKRKLNAVLRSRSATPPKHKKRCRYESSKRTRPSTSKNGADASKTRRARLPRRECTPRTRPRGNVSPTPYCAVDPPFFKVSVYLRHDTTNTIPVESNRLQKPYRARQRVQESSSRQSPAFLRGVLRSKQLR